MSLQTGSPVMPGAASALLAMAKVASPIPVDERGGTPSSTTLARGLTAVQQRSECWASLLPRRSLARSAETRVVGRAACAGKSESGDASFDTLSTR